MLGEAHQPYQEHSYQSATVFNIGKPRIGGTLIPKRFIREFFNRPRDDCRWLKRLTHKTLDRKLADFLPRPHYWTKLGLHQKVGLFLGIYFGSFAFWYDMGTGKTLLSLELLQYWWDAGLLRRALIFVTSDKAFPTWERQIRQYKITIPFCTLDASSSKEKWKILERFDEGIILLHYPGAVAMATKFKKKRRKGGKAKTLDLTKVNRLLSNVDAVIFDESTKVSNTGSLTFRLCRRASKQAEYRYALAGMPFGRNPMPLWAQMYLVDHGETLGETLGLFREAFFDEKDNHFGGRYSKIYTFRKSLKPKLSRMIQHNSLTYTADECIDLPPDLPIPVYLKLPADTKAYYDEIVGELITARGNMRAIKNAFHRLRQLSSGFMGLKDDETGERAEIEFAENPKLEWLLDKLDTFAEDRKALIYYQYTYSGRRIVAEMKKELGVDAVWLWSGTKNPREEIRSFIEDDDRQFAVINNQVGAYSLDGLQVANYEFFYESPVSVIDREQAKRRIVRQGQKHKTCFLYDLIVKGTMDEKILAFHKEGRDLFKALLTNPSKLL